MWSGPERMRSNTRIEPVARDEWTREAPRFSDYSYRQSWAYGEALAERRRAASVHVAIRRGNDLLGLVDVRVKKAPLGLGGMAYVSWGPLAQTGEPDDLERLVQCMEALRVEFVKRRRLLLRVDLQPSLRQADWSDRTAEWLGTAGFSRAARLPIERTFLLYLDQPLKELRSRLAQKWRNCLNRAERNGLTVRHGSHRQIFGEFCSLFSRFRQQKTFNVDLDAAFFMKVHDRMEPSARFDVALAEKDGQVVAGHVASMLGDTCVYLLGATEKAGLETKASYLLQWHVITKAKERGLRWYDLGGIDPVGNYGVFHFKRGLGGIEVSSPGPFEVAPSGPSGKLIRAAETLYLFSQRLRKRRTSRTQRTPITSIVSRSDS